MISAWWLLPAFAAGLLVGNWWASHRFRQMLDQFELFRQ